MWYKWGVQELRTSNVAESFHRLLGVLLGARYPRMDKVVRALHGCASEAKAALLNVEQRPTDDRKLRKKDIRGRRRV
nr:unnamed protein product [Haemonchus contortus]